MTYPNSTDLTSRQSVDLPIHFFTIVLNGQPFIQYHLPVFQQLKCDWHWHIIEGVAALKHDTAWSLASGGRIDDALHENGLSNDGTTAYLDQIAQQYPEQITLYRPAPGSFWDGKREMVNAPLSNLQAEGLLWQIDADELWTIAQLERTRQMFLTDPAKTAAFFWCNFFTGENLVVSSRHCYSQDPRFEWLRVWRYHPGMVWAKHEPPTLVQADGQDVAKINPFLHAETEAEGLVFQHFAYVTPEQLQFKQRYYGYQNAVRQWQQLQAQPDFPVFLRDYFAWVKDETVVDRVEDCGVVPIADRHPDNGKWQFRTDVSPTFAKLPAPKIAVDGVAFQLLRGGISRVWRSLLTEWVKTGFAKHLLVLDRGGTAPKIPGVRYCKLPLYDEKLSGLDSQILQEICDRENLNLFISTYYTAPTSTRSVLMVHDMIPEVMQADLNWPFWREKHFSILHAAAYIAVSRNTAQDLIRLYPQIQPDQVHVALNGLSPDFAPASVYAIRAWRSQHNISKPYFCFVGERFGFNGYKNAQHFFTAFSQWNQHQNYQIICIGGPLNLEPELAQCVARGSVQVLRLTDQELIAAYSGAIALVYPSRYEGFGLPILEAMACGCPVITCHNSSIPEVAGAAALYVSDTHPDQFVEALEKVQLPQVRHALIGAGFDQAKKFSWQKMATTIAEVLTQTSKEIEQQAIAAPLGVWSELRKLQTELQQQANPHLILPRVDQPQLLQLQLRSLLVEVEQMESSVFWQLRAVVQRVNRLFGKQSLDEAAIDLKAAPEIQVLQAKSRITWIQTSKFWKLRSTWLQLKSMLEPGKKTGQALGDRSP
ncbi:MAG: glycosyltransferase family 4 protein [Aphanocapsa sp. GSE-SYN-MK-11-07L]|jgi:glycosyltransferase involved in cell wall biosynthesis|nr:glycosyltransferase family 4 protein [Aphanocapsa sp. GSE-SYN-MK-11-07L]